MPVKTDTDIVLLNFTNTNNPLYDECENTWISNGEIKIIDNPTNFNIYKNKVAYFKNAYLYLNPKFTLGGDEDFTIDCYFQNLTNGLFPLYSIISSLSNQTAIGTYYNIGLEYWADPNSTNYIYNYKENYNYYTDKFYHYALEYHSSEKKMYCFLDGNLLSNNISMKLNQFIPTYIYLGYSKRKNLLSFTGYFTYFRISKKLLYSKNYDVIKALTQSEKININHNTKRLFSFNYDLNTIRETKWNQKVNMYALGPKNINSIY